MNHAYPALAVSEELLKRLEYAKDVRCSPKKDKCCLPGTRLAIIQEILNWINDGSDESIFWLTGVAGSGKSAIAHEIAKLMHVSQQCASFCFNSSDTINSRPELLFTTLSRDVCWLDEDWASSLKTILNNHTAIPNTSDVAGQFLSLVLHPSRNRTTHRTIVLIIDALDEAQTSNVDETGRKRILDVLADRAAELPLNLRILLTSRPLDDIHDALYNKAHVRYRSLSDLEEGATKSDIRTFIRHKLEKIADVEPEDLVVRSENNFQWASTACKFLTSPYTLRGSKRSDRLKKILEPNGHGLQGLYNTILDQTFGFGSIVDDRVLRFRMVIGRILDARRPLSRSSLRLLSSTPPDNDHDNDNDEDDVYVIISCLGALFHGATVPDEPIRPLHTSLRDFFNADTFRVNQRDPGSRNLYFVQRHAEEANLAFACLRIMRADLKFNICDLETSHVPNSAIGDLASRVEAIPDHLKYACHFWAEHLNHSPQETRADLTGSITEFLSTKLLFWAEVMSLTEAVGLAAFQARTLLQLAKVRERFVHLGLQLKQWAIRM
jgi:hypothetical protein